MGRQVCDAPGSQCLNCGHVIDAVIPGDYQQPHLIPERLGIFRRSLAAATAGNLVLILVSVERSVLNDGYVVPP